MATKDFDLVKFNAEFEACFQATIESKEPKRLWVTIQPAQITEVIKHLKNNNFTHFASITPIDTGTNFELIYHLYGNGLLISVRTLVDKAIAKIRSITELMPGAVLYEREVHDMLGVVCEGHPDLRTLILPEGWPEGEHPLRKDWKNSSEVKPNV